MKFKPGVHPWTLDKSTEKKDVPKLNTKQKIH